MITKAQVKHIRALADKKYRQESRTFLVEGEKMVKELLVSGFKIKEIYATREWIRQQSKLLLTENVIEVIDNELERISNLSTPNQVIAEVHMPHYTEKTARKAILLDHIKDPGNLGTIIRIADWYGVDTIYCSEHSTDCFNPKVIQASMGSIFRVKVHYKNIEQLVAKNKDKIIATALEATPLSLLPTITDPWLLMGNESEGLNPELLKQCKHIYSIPRIGAAESLNVAVATGIMSQAIYGS